MGDARHPALDHERRRLNLTVRVIDEEVRVLRELGWSGGAVPHATFQVRKWGWDKSDRLLAIRPSPYFGRIDVDDGDGHVESFYIGPEGLADPSRGERLIVDWRAPVSVAFYRPDKQTALRRRIEIRDSEIVRVYDDHVRSAAVGGNGRDTQADPVLHDLLANARGGQLGSIVRTIQAKQDEIIRTDDSLVIVQGAAGTGKTVVALHRLAYLLYQSRVSTQQGDDELPSDYPVSRRRTTPRSTPDLKVAVFGPNRTYLRHTRSVLPTLGENDVVQTTFEEWVLGSLEGQRHRGVPAEDDLEEILDASIPRQSREQLFRRARVKGSLEMGRILSEHAASELTTRLETFRREPLEIDADLAGRRYRYRISLPSLDASERRTQGIPLAHFRERTRQRMRQDIHEQARQSLIDRGILEVGSGDESHRYEQVLEDFDVVFERRWPRYRVPDMYLRLLVARPELRVAPGQGDPPSARTQGIVLEPRLEDLAPLAYLHLLIDGPIPLRVPGAPYDTWTRFDHVVIDEAQDLSPLAIATLRAHADRVTVLGDMNQAIYGHRGSRSWQEILQSLGNEARQIHTLSPTYRSTQQIAELANHIVRTGGLNGGVCRSFPRQGPEPRLLQATDSEQMQQAVITFVNEVCSDDKSTAAILTRTAADAQSLFTSIADRLPPSSVCITDRREASEGRVYVMPAYLAKGIELDAVVVTDVDDASYTKTVNDATLLYVAVTRALHRLLVVWAGQPSPLIVDRV